MKKITIQFFLGLFLVQSISSQNFASQTSTLNIKKTSEKIILDGILDEMAWKQSDSAYNFTQNFPSDTSLAIAQTVVYIRYDDQNIYIGAKLHNAPGSRKYVTTSLRRDFRGEGNDSFSVIFDPFQDKTNGTIFGMNPFGVRREGFISNGGSGRDAYSFDWDNKWDGASKVYDGYWTVEMAIPFNTLRYNEDQKEWNINFYRIDSKTTEKSSWSYIPRNLSIGNMASNQKLIWDAPTKKTGANISVIPFITSGISKDFFNNKEVDDPRNVGFDMKYGISSGLNLDLTVNPDFSQVEVDDQVTNLDRFEIFFPEKRQFFLENADLFANNGNRNTRPFFSRRIGIATDTATGLALQNPIPYGLRLSGKVSQNTRVGLLNMQGASDASIQQPGINYTVATVQQKVLTRSNLDFIFVNKQPFKLNLGDSSYKVASNQTAGLDFNLLSSDNKWSGNLFSHHSFDQVQVDKAYAMGTYLSYNTLNWTWYVFSQQIGAGYNPEVGYVKRTGIRQLSSTIRYSYFPKSSKVQSHGPGFDFDVLGRQSVGLLDWDMNLLYRIKFNNTSSLDFRLRRQFTQLTSDFDPSGSEGQELLENDSYYYNFIIGSWTSNERRKLNVKLKTNSGQYFNGHRLNFSGTLGYRYQPFGTTSIDITYNRIKLPSPYNSSQLYLIGPKFDFTFTKKLFWTTYVQYNSQIENLNINSRLQWRFKPVSDIYLVYTDNYFAYNQIDGFFQIGAVKYRAISFKITYWLNL